MQSYGAVLKLPQLRRLMLASVPADLADWLDYVAVIALMVYSWQQGPFALAWLVVAMSLPGLLIGPLLAVWVDRTDLRLALVLSNAGRALTTFGLIFAPDLPVLLLLVFTRAAIDSAFTPARQAALQALAPTELTGPANGMLFAINQTTKIAGPALGGLILALSAPQSVFAVNTAMSLLAAIILLGIKVPARAPREHRSILAEAPAGFAEFLKNRRLLGVMLFVVAGWAFLFLYDALISILMQGFGYGSDLFGYAISAVGLGGVLGALLAGAIPIRRELLWMGSAALVGGPLSLLIGVLSLAGYPLPFPGFAALLFCNGVVMGFVLVPYRTTLQRETPPDRIARVFAAAEALTIVVVLVAPFIGSWIADGLGVGATFVVGGAGLALVGLVALAFGLRRQPFGHTPQGIVGTTTDPEPNVAQGRTETP